MQVRAAERRDNPAIAALVAADPVTHCFAAHHLAERRRLARAPRDVLVAVSGGRVDAAVVLGANLIPLGTSGASRAAFAPVLARQGRRCSSIVGPAAEVLPLWHELDPVWGPARDVRARQPLLSMAVPSTVPVDPAVRPARADEVDVLMPAAVAMFTEEVGVSPLSGGTGQLYRRRVAELVGRGWVFARIEDGRVVFKAELGAVSPAACQVHGVWVAPDLRGQGLAAPAMSAVVRLALEIAPKVTLYVNDFNTPALRAYARVGFTDVGQYATVLF